ncbi:hypothetical protein ACFLQ5_02250 [Bacteroidota bacterium]
MNGIVCEIVNNDNLSDTIPIVNVSVFILNSETKKILNKAITDSLGRFEMEITQSDYILGFVRAEKECYIEYINRFPTVGTFGYPAELICDIILKRKK